MIQVRNLTKSFRHVAVLRQVSFDAPDGAITGLLGPNGAGKTTTLRAIAGLLTPDGGIVRVGHCGTRGHRLQAPRDLGALLDHRGLYGRLTGREHLAYFGRLRGLSGTVLHDRVDRVLGTLGLVSIADRPAQGFSEGERVKVALGCAIVHDPSHVVLDEPTSGLDVRTVRALRGWLRELRDRGACIVFSSHVLGDVEQLCDRVVVMARGAVVAEGALADVRNGSAPGSLEDAFVALTEPQAALSC